MASNDLNTFISYPTANGMADVLARQPQIKSTARSRAKSTAKSTRKRSKPEDLSVLVLTDAIAKKVEASKVSKTKQKTTQSNTSRSNSPGSQSNKSPKDKDLIKLINAATGTIHKFSCRSCKKGHRAPDCDPKKHGGQSLFIRGLPGRPPNNCSHTQPCCCLKRELCCDPTPEQWEKIRKGELVTVHMFESEEELELARATKLSAMANNSSGALGQPAVGPQVSLGMGLAQQQPFAGYGPTCAPAYALPQGQWALASDQAPNFASWNGVYDQTDFQVNYLPDGLANPSYPWDPSLANDYSGNFSGLAQGLSLTGMEMPTTAQPYLGFQQYPVMGYNGAAPGATTMEASTPPNWGAHMAPNPGAFPAPLQRTPRRPAISLRGGPQTMVAYANATQRQQADLLAPYPAAQYAGLQPGAGAVDLASHFIDPELVQFSAQGADLGAGQESAPLDADQGQQEDPLAGVDLSAFEPSTEWLDNPYGFFEVA